MEFSLSKQPIRSSKSFLLTSKDRRLSKEQIQSRKNSAVHSSIQKHIKEVEVDNEESDGDQEKKEEEEDYDEEEEEDYAINEEDEEENQSFSSGEDEEDLKESQVEKTSLKLPDISGTISRPTSVQSAQRSITTVNAIESITVKTPKSKKKKAHPKKKKKKRRNPLKLTDSQIDLLGLNSKYIFKIFRN